MGAVIRGIGTYYPDEILTNADLEKRVETTDEWITSRTGIRQRRILPKDSPLKASDFGTFAAKAAMEKAGIGAEEIEVSSAPTSIPISNSRPPPVSSRPSWARRTPSPST
jgi:3-oxoacyl-[acyl-carrier-protein] synthase-3